VLRDEWGFDGFVVSDYNSVHQLVVHGFAADAKESAFEAVTAGVDMEMAGAAYSGNLAGLVEEGRVDIEKIDTAVANILRAKFRLGLFENPYTNPSTYPAFASEIALRTAKTAALQSVVMLKNESATLPLSRESITSVAVIGPLADAPYEQMGTWVFDGDPGLSVTGVDGIRELVADELDVRFVRAMETSRSRENAAFDDAVAAARESDVAILFLGEEAILSGEAHSRANIDLPGDQAELVRRVRETGKPVIAVILAGRPLTLSNIVDQVDAILFAWHPGSMGGAAIADLLFGIESPSGKLPVTFPKMVGQIPIYYNQKNTGKPPRHGEIVYIDDINAHAPQTSLGMSAFHLDAGFEPLYPFGFGLSYADFSYDNINSSAAEVHVGDTVTISADLSNHGPVAAVEVVQLYLRDLVGNVTRPVRELKGFRRVRVEPGQTVKVAFDIDTNDLAFFGRDNRLILEAGDFHAWIGGSSTTELRTEFRLVGQQ
jgi:beta-glucosidase